MPQGIITGYTRICYALDIQEEGLHGFVIRLLAEKISLSSGVVSVIPTFPGVVCVWMQPPFVSLFGDKAGGDLKGVSWESDI